MWPSGSWLENFWPDLWPGYFINGNIKPYHPAEPVAPDATTSTSKIIAKYSDYTIHSIEYFIKRIESELLYRDLTGLTSGKINKINVTKQHPLVSLMSSYINPDAGRNADLERSSIIPAISVTPASSSDDGFTLGKSYKSEVVNAQFITDLKVFADKTNREIQSEVLLTQSQIEIILAKYKRVPAGTMRVQRNEWRKNEEINISVWSDTPDVDILIGNLMDSMLSFIQVGFIGDNSPFKNFKYRITKGLTNFNYGRVLFGSEYNVTFLNTFNNFLIYSDMVLSGHDFYGTFEVPTE